MRVGIGPHPVGEPAKRLRVGIHDPPVAVPGYLATDPAQRISQHHGRCHSVIQMPETYLMFFCIPPDGKGSADQATVKSKSFGREDIVRRVFQKITPVLKYVKK